jgi:hypothetical protein
MTQTIEFTQSGRSQYAHNVISACCGEDYHRPAGSRPGDAWFCMGCGATRPDAREV